MVATIFLMTMVVSSSLQSYWACVEHMYQCLPVATESAGVISSLLP